MTQDSRITFTKTLPQGGAGTLNYMAPETPEGKICAKSDIYSAGLVMFDMFYPPTTANNGNLQYQRPSLMEIKMEVGRTKKTIVF